MQATNLAACKRTVLTIRQGNAIEVRGLSAHKQAFRQGIQWGYTFSHKKQVMATCNTKTAALQAKLHTFQMRHSYKAQFQDVPLICIKFRIGNNHTLTKFNANI